MTIHNYISRGVFNDALKKALGIQKPGGALERFGETLTPIIDLWAQPEWARLRSEQLAGNAISAAAVVGEFSYAGLLNSTGSGALVVVERISVTGGAAISMILALLTEAEFTTAGLVASSTVSRDSRWGATGRLRMQSGSHTTSLGLSLELMAAIATETRQLTVALPVVVSPGFGLALIGQTVNTAFTSNWAWRDRANAFPGELTP